MPRRSLSNPTISKSDQAALFQSYEDFQNDANTPKRSGIGIDEFASYSGSNYPDSYYEREAGEFSLANQLVTANFEGFMQPETRSGYSNQIVPPLMQKNTSNGRANNKQSGERVINKSTVLRACH